MAVNVLPVKGYTSNHRIFSLRILTAPLPMSRRPRLSPINQLFLGLLGLTTLVWILRGLTLLAFLPSLVIWILLLASIGVGIVGSLQKIR